MTESTGRIALVTGGSQGIGFATATLLAGKGYRVALAGRGADHLATARERLMALGMASERILSVEMEVGDEASMKRGVEEVRAAWGDIEILVNNAGRLAPPAPFDATNLATLRDAVEVNLFGTAFLCNEVMPAMRRRRWGRIVNVASTAGLGASYRQVPYSVSKAAVIALTKSLAVDGAPDGVCINAVAPGPVATENYRASKGEAAVAKRALPIPSGRLAESEDVAEVIGFLVSEGAAHVSGQTIAIDGAEQAAGAYAFQWVQMRTG
jgi:NAD(P)-dependent dehydrogenase (short-subunit alcohol dehydrogenase family)